MKRWDVMTARPGRDKVFWHRVGTAFEGDKGISIVFDSLPLADDRGQVRVSLFEPREKQSAGSLGWGKGGGYNNAAGDLDDSLPPF